MSIAISLLALLATFYQLYLQRVHNERSLKPLGQIILSDRESQLSVYIKNNGVGPMIIDRVIFFKNGISSTNIEDHLNLDPKSYKHDIVSAEIVQKVLLPGALLEIFETMFGGYSSSEEKENVIKQLTPLKIAANYRDIYNNKFSIERDFQWFSRHVLSECE